MTPNQMAEIRSVAALPAELTVAQLTAGGVSEVRDDWTEAARTHARAVLEGMRGERIVFLADLETRPELADDIREVRELFEVIDANYMVFGLSIMAAPTARFEFSVGSIDHILEAAQADAILVIGGKDEIFTADRKVMAALSIVASAALTGNVIAPGSGTAHISAGLIGRDGTVLWWNFVGDGEIGDLRTPEGVADTMQRLLGPMPRSTASAVPLADAASEVTPTEAAPAGAAVEETPEALPGPATEIESPAAPAPAPAG
jgi:hypothetical protein